MLTIEPRHPGRPSCVGSGSWAIMCLTSSREQIHRPRRLVLMMLSNSETCNSWEGLVGPNMPVVYC